MEPEDRIKLFGMSLALVERELDKVEKRLKLDLGRYVADDKDDEYYPQFEVSYRDEAQSMSAHYEMFYCLEKSIRKLVADTLQSQEGALWWTTCVPKNVMDNAERNKQRETDSGVTSRSESNLDYTTFGELGDVVRHNWKHFDSIFSSVNAFSKIMTSLNQLRGPIAHCCPLADDEVVRLRLTVRDWFRLME
jgi:hypothetical protein